MVKCAEVIERNIQCGTPDESVEDVAEQMRDRNTGVVLVCDDEGSLVGIVTDRDLVVRVLAEREAADGVRVADVMTTDIVFCHPDDDLSVAEELMAEYQKRQVVCVDYDGRPIGIVRASHAAACAPRLPGGLLHRVSGRLPSQPRGRRALSHRALARAVLTRKGRLLPRRTIRDADGRGEPLRHHVVIKSHR